MTVLIIEENRDLAMCFAAPFVGYYDVCICTNRSSAIKLLFELQPDALIVDLAVLFKLKPLPYHPKAIIAVANFVTSDIISEVTAKGVHELILLPCKADHLLKRINARLHPPNKELI